MPNPLIGIQMADGIMRALFRPPVFFGPAPVNQADGCGFECREEDAVKCKNCSRDIRPSTPDETRDFQLPETGEWIHTTGFFACDGMQETYAEPDMGADHA